MTSMSKICVGAIAAGGLAGAASGAVTWNEMQFLTSSPTVVHFPGWDDSSVDPRGADDGVVDSEITMPNFIGADLRRMNIKIIPDTTEDYSDGPFGDIVFDQTALTAVNIPNATFQFTDSQNLLFTFAPGDYFGPGDFATFTFTILTPDMKLFDLEFEPQIVPTPGALALAGFAGLAGVRRRR